MPLRKHLVLLSDVLILSSSISLFGVSGAPIYPVYIWLVIGSGLRFGLHFLHYTSAISIFGFSIAVCMSPSWMAQIELAIGLGIAMIIMPLFFLKLLKQNYKTMELLERKIKETEHMVIHDALTNLPNRLYLEQKLTLAMTSYKTNEHQLTLFFVDLNSFKFINDTFGHVTGDELIIKFSKRLESCLRTSDMLCRLSGDAFMILLDSQHSHEYSAQLATKLIEKTTGQYQIHGHDIFVNFSVGIAHYPLDGDDVESLIKNADTALHYAKKHTKSHYRFYDKQMSKEMSDELTVQTDLRKALEKNEFELYYQPQVNTKSGNVTGAEALLRWNHPIKGLINPESFIDAAERNAIMFDIGRWIVERACADRARWNTLGITEINLSINVSGRQFLEETFVEHLSQSLDRYNIAPHQIALEITERIFVHESATVQNTFEQLKNMHIKLYLDDFGTGYSSLSYLKNFPIDTIKIDQSFIKDLPYDEDACNLAKAILAIGHSLKKNIVAEGVETQAQYEALKQWGCESIQGFYFKKPMPENIFLSFLISNTKSPGVITTNINQQL